MWEYNLILFLTSGFLNVHSAVQRGGSYLKLDQIWIPHKIGLVLQGNGWDLLHMQIITSPVLSGLSHCSFDLCWITLWLWAELSWAWVLHLSSQCRSLTSMKVRCFEWPRWISWPERVFWVQWVWASSCFSSSSSTRTSLCPLQTHLRTGSCEISTHWQWQNIVSLLNLIILNIICFN